MIILATICMIPYTFIVIVVSIFVTIIPSKRHSIAIAGVDTRANTSIQTRLMALATMTTT
jgi:hypothetical protein